MAGLPGDPQGGRKLLRQPRSRPSPDTCGTASGGLCGGQTREAGFSKGLRCSWPFVCMNYRCSPPQVAGHGSPSGAPHWGESSGLSAPVSTWELPIPSPPPSLMCPGLHLGFHSAQNQGGGRGAGDRTLTPQCVSAEQEGPRGWQPGTGGRPEGRGWGRSPEGLRTWKLVPKACPTNGSPEIHSSDGVPCCRTSSSPLTYLLILLRVLPPPDAPRNYPVHLLRGRVSTPHPPAPIHCQKAQCRTLGPLLVS